jgi:hypothetical protein
MENIFRGELRRKMKNVTVLTDSLAGIPEELIKKI